MFFFHIFAILLSKCSSYTGLKSSSNVCHHRYIPHFKLPLICLSQIFAFIVRYQNSLPCDVVSISNYCLIDFLEKKLASILTVLEGIMMTTLAYCLRS